MIHFVYPNASTEGEEKKEFIGCGRYAVSETVPEGYALPFAKMMNRSKVSGAALILAKESSDKGVKKQVVQKKGEKYVGESLHLAYLFALINRARAVKLDIHTDIWCTGSIEVSDEKPFLKSVESESFQLKLEKGFLSEENKDMLFIVPEGDIQPAHEELCSKNNAEILSLEDFKKCLSEDKGIFQKKTVLKVRGDELFSLVNLVFELGPNPYKGLQYFDENDADRFFGREKLTDELFEKYQNLWNSPLRLMAIDGPSGLGKSSVVRAGLVHRRLCRLWDISGVRLSKCPPEKTPPFVMILRPGETPVKTLAEKLFSETEFVSSLSDIQSGLIQPDGQGEFNGLLKFFNKISDNSSRLVIIVDQFEEIYSQCKNAEERDLFVNNLLYAAKHPAAQIMVIIVLRSEFLDRINRHNSVFYNDIVRNRITIEAMTGNQIRSAVTEPARRSGYIFDAKTVDRLISETEKHEGALPLLEFALDSIWKGMEKGVQPADTLEKLNGVGGALASKAQEIYDGLAGDADRRIARRAFLSLINIGEGTFDTRRRALLSEITAKDEHPEHVRNVLYQFSKPGEAYFITLSTDAEGRETAEITHEALFEHWDSLKKWLDDKRNVLPLARDLEKAVQDWHVQAQDADLLWRGSKLDSLKDYHEGNKQDMTELQHDFFKAGVEAKKREEAEKEAVRQRELTYNRRLRIYTVTAVLTAIAALYALWYYWDGYSREHVEYYSNYAKRYGIMQGVGKLTDDQVRHRRASFKFVHKGRYNPVLKVQAVNAKGELLIPSDLSSGGVYVEQVLNRECQWEFVLNSTGKIVYEKAYNDKDQLVWSLVYSPPLKGQPTRALFADSGGLQSQVADSPAMFVKLEYSDRGDETARYFVDNNDSPQPEPLYKAYGILQKFDDRGLVIEKTYIDKDNKPMKAFAVSATQKYGYDELGNLTEWACFDIEGKPMILYVSGCHKVTVKYYDGWTEWACFDTEGKPMLNEKYGWCKFASKYDDRGIAQYDKFGNQFNKTFFNEMGKTISSEAAFFDEQGKPTLHKDGYHKCTCKYDDNGKITELLLFDAEGSPTLHKEGFHKLTVKYDDRGNKIEMAYFDEQGKPMLYKDGYQKSTAKYDERGNETEVAYFDIKDRPTLHKDGYHKEATKYDDGGNWTEASYFDTEGKPTLNKNGFHRVTAKYDNRGTRTEGAYFDVNGQLLETEVVVADVLPDSQAVKSGIKAGDIFTHYDGKPLSDYSSFIAARNAEPPDGPPKELKVLRDGKELSFMILPGKIGVELRDRVKAAAVSP